MIYVKFKHLESGKFYILAESRMNAVLENLKWQNTKTQKAIEIIEKFEGATLNGIEYVPLFNYFEQERARGCFRVIAEDFVTSSDGSGVVHCAPGFGADDFDACS